MHSSDEVNTEIVELEKELAECLKSLGTTEDAKSQIAIEIQELKNKIGVLLIEMRKLANFISTGRHNVKILEIKIGDKKRQYFRLTKEGL